MLQALDVTRDQVDFQVDPAAGFDILQVGRREGVRYQVDFKILTLHAVDGEADAVHRDRTLARDVLGQIPRRADDQEKALSRRVETYNLAHAVDMAGHQMPTQAVRQAQGFLQIDLVRPGDPNGAVT